MMGQMAEEKQDSWKQSQSADLKDSLQTGFEHDNDRYLVRRIICQIFTFVCV